MVHAGASTRSSAIAAWSAGDPDSCGVCDRTERGPIEPPVAALWVTLSPMAADIEADPDMMRVGAAQLAALADELASAAARVRGVPVGAARVSERLDDLVRALSRHVVDLALIADRTRRHADELDAQEQLIGRWFE
jgi:hypothetical protein